MTFVSSDAMPERNAPIAMAGDDALDARTRFAIAAGYLLLRILGATWRVQVHGRATLLARSGADPRVVLTLWHGQLLPITWAHRQPTASMVSEHRDGEIISRVLARLGFSAIRGSTSRGGARALLEAVRVLARGADVAITPDGPRGPRHSVAPGALALAARAGAAIVPIVAHVDRKWQLRSWDRFEIPKPFARVTISYGTPVRIDARASRATAATAAQLGARMHAETERVVALARGLTSEPLPPYTVDDGAGYPPPITR